MSQRAVFLEVDGAIHPEVMHAMPDIDDCVAAARDLECEPCEGDTCVVNATWYEIGEGESDTDNFFPEETLVEWRKNGKVEEEAGKRGYCVEVIQTDTTVLTAEDFEDFED